MATISPTRRRQLLVAAAWADVLTAADPAVVHACLTGRRWFDRAALGTLAPVRAVCGEHDALCRPSAARALAARVPQVQETPILSSVVCVRRERAGVLHVVCVSAYSPPVCFICSGGGGEG
jgi:hypothetical protein